MTSRSYEVFRDALASRLAEPPPRSAVRGASAPELSYGRHNGPAPPDCRHAAVMALCYLDRGQWRIPMTLRPDHMVDHPGQVSLPGGLTESGETPEQCALRETEEELGIPRESVELVGRMSPVYVFASNFCVTPCVAVSRARPEFQPSPVEVAEVLELPLASLSDAACRGVMEMQYGGIVTRAPSIVHGGRRIWGATCIMLAELAEVLRQVEEDLAGRPSAAGPST